MKSKKILVLLILLAVILFLGIGYALSTTNLEIKGDATVTATDDNFVVKFTKADNDENGYAEGSITDDTHATITVNGLKKANDTATVTYTISNESNGLDALVNVTSAAIVAKENGNADDANYFKVETEGITTDTKLEAGNTTTVKVKVTLLKTPVEDKAATVKVDLTAKPAEQAN